MKKILPRDHFVNLNLQSSDQPTVVSSTWRIVLNLIKNQKDFKNFFTLDSFIIMLIYLNVSFQCNIKSFYRNLK